MIARSPNLDRLLVDPSLDGGDILSLDGRPVWPSADLRDRAALSRLASLFAARLEDVRAAPQPARAGPEIVAGLGVGVDGAARLYAHLTERSFRHADRVADLLEIPRPSVVVTTPAWIRMDLLDALYAPDREGPAPGLICAATPGALRRQVLLRSAASVLAGPLDTPALDFLPTLRAPPPGAEGARFLGAGADAAAVRAALSEAAGVLTIMTHTDGIDGYLGPLVLCPMDRMPDASDPERLPSCRATGVCHRLSTPVQEALASDRLLPPEQIAARILVLAGCWGILLDGAPVAHELALAPRLLESDALGAILTTWEIVFGDANDFTPLRDRLAAGEPAGAALAAFMRSPHARQKKLRMCLLGDPRVRLPAQGARAATGDPPSAAPDRSEFADVGFLRAYVGVQLPGLDGPALDAAAEVLSAADLYEHTGWVGERVEGRPEAAGPALREAMLRFVFLRGSMPSTAWQRLAGPLSAAPEARRCYGCDNPANVFDARLRVHGAAPRRLTLCPRCGIIEDAPRDFAGAMRFSVEGARIHLSGRHPGAPWAAGLLYDPPLAAERQGFLWPTDARGCPLPSFEPPEPWRGGVVRLAIYVLWGGEMATLQLPARGLPGPRGAPPLTPRGDEV